MFDTIKYVLFNSHSRMERFTVLFITLSTALMLCTGSIALKKYHDDNRVLSVKVLYTEETATSLSDVKVDVVGIWKNTDSTKLFLMMKMEDMSKLSADANTYQMFLTGQTMSLTDKRVTSNPVANLYIFGSSGYMGVYMVDAGGFPQQIWAMTFRANAKLGEYIAPNPKDYNGSESFLAYDQWRIWFNPGGADCATADFLNKEGKIDLSEIYEETVARTAETAYRKQLRDDLVKMNLELNRINEMTTRLQDHYGIMVSQTPEAIKNDKIVAMAGGLACEYDIIGQTYRDQTGATYTEDQVTFYLETPTVSEKGINYNWQDGSVKEGYLADLVGESNPTSWINTRRGATSYMYFPNVSDIQWYYNNGDRFIYNQDGAQGAIAGTDTEIHNTISQLLTSWRSYYDLKCLYTEEHLYQLLYLEIQTKEANLGYSINSDPSLFIKY